VIPVALEVFGDGPMREEAGRYDVGNRDTATPRHLTRLAEVDLQEAPVLAGHEHEGAQGLDDSRPRGPTCPDTRRQRHDGHTALAQSLNSKLPMGSAGLQSRHIARLDVADLGLDGEAIVGETRAALAQIRAKLLVEHRVEPVAPLDLRRLGIPRQTVALRCRVRDAEQVADQRPEQSIGLPGLVALRAEVIQLRPTHIREVIAVLSHQLRRLQRIVARRHHRFGALQQRAHGPVLVHAEVVHQRVDGERE